MNVELSFPAAAIAPVTATSGQAPVAPIIAGRPVTPTAVAPVPPATSATVAPIVAKARQPGKKGKTATA